METFELRYFREVARQENIHRASERLKVSTASLSKAISRLEAELEVKLFEREGRGIRLSVHGKTLLERSEQMLSIEESVRTEMKGGKSEISVVIAGPEALLTKFGVELSEQVQKKFPRFQFEFQICSEDEALKRVKAREAHFALTTSDIPHGFKVKQVDESLFVTVAGKNNKIFSEQKPDKGIDVSKVQMAAFVSARNRVFGSVGDLQSSDGWRDDRFPRIQRYLSSSSKLIEQLVSQGKALAYVPDYLAEPFVVTGQWKIIKVLNCPFSCRQKIRIVTRNPIELSWIVQVF